MDNATISRIGTIFYALVIAFFGINHFMYGTGMQKMVPAFLPGGVAWVYITGACLLLAAIAFLINRQVRLAGFLLCLFLLLSCVQNALMVNYPPHVWSTRLFPAPLLFFQN